MFQCHVHVNFTIASNSLKLMFTFNYICILKCVFFVFFVFFYCIYFLRNDYTSIQIPETIPETITNKWHKKMAVRLTHALQRGQGQGNLPLQLQSRNHQINNMLLHIIQSLSNILNIYSIPTKHTNIDWGERERGGEREERGLREGKKVVISITTCPSYNTLFSCMMDNAQCQVSSSWMHHHAKKHKNKCNAMQRSVWLFPNSSWELYEYHHHIKFIAHLGGPFVSYKRLLYQKRVLWY